MANQVNGNAVQLKEEEEPMDTSSVTHTEHYKTLIEAGLPQKVAERLDEIFQTGIMHFLFLIGYESEGKKFQIFRSFKVEKLLYFALCSFECTAAFTFLRSNWV